ncbi:hypothetical protein ND748_10450 [Frankia sp. AiPs1]|uniref:hypothetical protein n=1 Tax=Frankia sp. AiPs1 TaxID=573493 RepID=UPI002044BC4B|nr:hypothetical protein [Frankia sp. AiPs1]MCM3922076.1 hypothetical protein [Frankia sp. AiPs1]
MPPAHIPPTPPSDADIRRLEAHVDAARVAFYTARAPYLDALTRLMGGKIRRRLPTAVRVRVEKDEDGWCVTQVDGPDGIVLADLYNQASSAIFEDLLDDGVDGDVHAIAQLAPARLRSNHFVELP